MANAHSAAPTAVQRPSCLRMSFRSPGLALGCLLAALLAVGASGGAHTTGPPKDCIVQRDFDQRLDHFGFRNAATFKQRTFMCARARGEGLGGPDEWPRRDLAGGWKVCCDAAESPSVVDAIWADLEGGFLTREAGLPALPPEAQMREVLGRQWIASVFLVSGEGWDQVPRSSTHTCAHAWRDNGGQ